MLTGLEKLAALKARAEKAVSLKKQGELKKRLLKARDERRLISEDYAGRLAEKAIFRNLLAEHRLDAERFVWYFTHIENQQSLDDVRRWIDGKLEKERCSRSSASPSSPAGT